jgi:hypothetical protein
MYGSTSPFVVLIASSCLLAQADSQRLERFMNTKQTDRHDRDWAELRGQWQQGDELWQFRTSDESWKRHRGWEGYALVRNEKVVGAVVTAQN